MTGSPWPKRAGLVSAVLVVAVAAYVAGRGVATERSVRLDRPVGPVTAVVDTGPLREAVMGSARVVPRHNVPVPVPALPPGYLPIVTALYVKEGESVASGEALAAVAQRPVIVLPGRIPAYRTMSIGDRGPDVRQLRDGLVGLGLLRSPRADVFDGATARALARLYATHGFRTEPAGGRGVPLGEIVFVPHLPALVTEVNVGLGDSAAQGVLMTLADPRVRLIGTVPAIEAERLVRGQRAEISLEGGVVLPATVERVLSEHGSEEDPRTDMGSPASEPGVLRRVILSPKEPVPLRYLGAEGRLTVVTAKAPRSSLVVPVTAISVSADGRYWVEVVTDQGRRRVDVRLGLVASGRVVVTPLSNGLGAGDRVVVSWANLR